MGASHPSAAGGESPGFETAPEWIVTQAQTADSVPLVALTIGGSDRDSDLQYHYRTYRSFVRWVFWLPRMRC